MSDYKNEKYVTWDDIQGQCRDLARRLLEMNCPHLKILAITRGGLFPAGILARELDIREVESVCIDTYQMQERGEPVMLKPPAPEFCDGVIVVDDLADTGATLQMLRRHLKNALIVTVYTKPQGEDLVDLYHEKVAQDTWVRFPWDTDHGRAYVKPLALEEDLK
ncbi:MAG: xanthine phosphoribosyltransferase [Micavibrio sp.]|nr:xanthine phosphoribosyltransferase [Micavibrio sp.]